MSGVDVCESMSSTGTFQVVWSHGGDGHAGGTVVVVITGLTGCAFVVLLAGLSVVSGSVLTCAGLEGIHG